MSRTQFEDLAVYRLAERLADRVWDVVRGWDPFTRDTVGWQLVRPADGIGANVAEGAGRGNFQDNRRFVRIARGSLHETKHWLRRAYRRGLLDEAQVADLRPMLEEFSPRLNAYLRSIGRDRRATDHGPRTTDP